MPDLRVIPSIEELRQREDVRSLERRYGRGAVVQALREEAAALRQRLTLDRSHDAGAPRIQDASEAAASIEVAVDRRLRAAFQPSLCPVINATGVVLHTNLGRAPLAPVAAAQVAALATGYTNLEYDLERGRRGSRDRHAEPLLCRLTGAEAAVVVNNNAAATLLLLAALASGREVLISRGELVEIGGGFRIPDVMAQSGALLREVGTTNKTRASDYAAAVSERTALILRVHPSNFTIEGFTERPALEDLVAVGVKLNVPVAEDLGSGNLLTTISDEPVVAASIEAGASVVCFSGDKLLGGPQCGVLVGTRELIGRIRSHPLMRALRVDKMTYAALEATLLEYLGGRAAETVPAVRMISMTAETIAARAHVLADRLSATRGLRAEIVEGVSATGGGSAPGLGLPTRLLALTVEGRSLDAVEAELRAFDPPVIARIENDRLLFDLRTVLPEQDALLADALCALARSPETSGSGG